MVRSWTGWNRLSVNCSSRHDFPTPDTEARKEEDEHNINITRESGHSLSAWRVYMYTRLLL